MTGLQLVVAHAVKLGLLVLLIGIVRRGRLGQCWSFAAYALATLLGNSLVSFWPSRFYSSSFWILKQAVYDILKTALALELAWAAFRAFPGAMRTARRLLLIVLAASTCTLALLTPPSSYMTVWEWQPRVLTAALWLLTATALMVVWFQVPLDDWRRAIMLGLAPYQLVFVILLGLLKRHGWSLLAPIAMIETLAFLALVVFWAWAAWRPVPARYAVGIVEEAA
jgi:hypothetical protein